MYIERGRILVLALYYRRKIRRVVSKWSKKREKATQDSNNI